MCLYNALLIIHSYSSCSQGGPTENKRAVEGPVKKHSVSHNYVAIPRLCHHVSALHQCHDLTSLETLSTFWLPGLMI